MEIIFLALLCLGIASLINALDTRALRKRVAKLERNAEGRA